MSRLADWLRGTFTAARQLSPDDVRVVWPPTPWREILDSDRDGQLPGFIWKWDEPLSEDPYVWVDPWEGR